ncbi:acetyl esterase [Pseudomonas sp. F-14 TE3623]
MISNKTFDPEVLALFAHMQSAGFPDMAQLSLTDARQAYLQLSAMLGGSPVDIHKFTDHVIQGNESSVKIRLYYPLENLKGKQPVVIYLHGGGWVMGDINSHDKVCRRLAKATGYVVASVDYRLAPENAAPAGISDVLLAAQWIHKQANEIEVDAHRIAIAGDSAGGNLAALCSTLLRNSDIEIRAQVLFYPCTDLREQAWDYPSRRINEDVPPLTRALCKKLMDVYLLTAQARQTLDLSPLAYPDLTGLPPTLIFTAEHDVLRDDGARYAEALLAAGNTVEHIELPGMVHGFIELIGALPGTAKTMEKAASFIQEKM